jgi:hypothetical protein
MTSLFYYTTQTIRLKNDQSSKSVGRREGVSRRLAPLPKQERNKYQEPQDIADCPEDRYQLVRGDNKTHNLLS